MKYKENSITQIVCIIMFIVNLFLPNDIAAIKMMLLWAVIYLSSLIKEYGATLNFTVKVTEKQKEDTNE